MILSRLSQRDLQETVGTELIERLTTLLPPLLGDDYDPTAIYKKQMLIRILRSFSPSKRMRDEGFRYTLLNSLPPQELDAICSKTGVGKDEKTFAERVKALVLNGWSSLEFCTNCLLKITLT